MCVALPPLKTLSPLLPSPLTPPLQVAKNIVLAGVGSVTLVDDTPCSRRPPCNFLITNTVAPDTT